MKRKGPTVSATLFKEGTIKIGNDGRKWIIKSFNGIPRWVPQNDDALKLKNGEIFSFDFDKIKKKIGGKLTKLGTITITSNKIGIGEIIYDAYPAKKGKYHIYDYNYSLIAVHENQSLNHQNFVLNGNVSCDIGMFSFLDYARIINYSERQSIYHFEYNLINNNQIKKYDAYYLYETHLKIYNNLVSKKTNSKIIRRQTPKINIKFDSSQLTKYDLQNPVGIFAGNGFGDGGFFVFKGQNAYFILSDLTNDLIRDHFKF